MTPDEPYSRVYHKLADEYPDVYDSPDLAGFVRLLVAADQTWPTSARWAGLASRASVERLQSIGLILVDGARYRIKGMDKERAERSASASHAARSRWGNAPRNADGNAPRNAETMPRRDETSKDETRRVDADAYDAYYALTTRTPSKAVMDWLDRLVTEHGAATVTTSMSECWTESPSVKDFLGRVEVRCTRAAKRRQEASEKRRQDDELAYQRSIQRAVEDATPEERARAERIKAGISEFLKGATA